MWTLLLCFEILRPYERLLKDYENKQNFMVFMQISALFIATPKNCKGYSGDTFEIITKRAVMINTCITFNN